MSKWIPKVHFKIAFLAKSNSLARTVSSNFVIHRIFVTINKVTLKLFVHVKNVLSASNYLQYLQIYVNTLKHFTKKVKIEATLPNG